jgi:excisionase family DNA binding protein
VDETFLTAPELARWLKVKLPTIRRWQWEEDLPCLRVGRLVRYRADEVLRWLETRAAKTASIQGDSRTLLGTPCGRGGSSRDPA